LLVLGHVATATLACRALDRKVDLRWVVFFTLLADLVDKPLGLVVFRETINNGRVWFHSISVNLLVTLLLVLGRKPGVYALALWLHQACDRMWTRPWVALWPLTGAFAYRDLDFEDWLYSVFGPYNVVSEIAGFAVLTAFAWSHRLYRPARFRAWLRTGALDQEPARRSDRPWRPG
jgi:hypothetical protein